MLLFNLPYPGKNIDYLYKTSKKLKSMINRVNQSQRSTGTTLPTINPEPTTSIRSNKGEYLLNSIAKPIFERSMSWIFCDEIAKAAELIYPYFGFNKKTALAFTMAGTNIFLGFMIPIQQNALRTLIDIAVKNPHASNLYIYPLLILVGIKAINPIIHSKNAVSCKELRDELSYEMRNDFGESWLRTMTFVGFSKSEAGLNIISPTDDLVHKTDSFCQNLVSLTNARISILAHFIGALYSLYLISGFLEISLLGLSFNIPHLILISISYAYAYNFVASWANAIVKKSVHDKSVATDQFSKQTNNFHTQAKSIAFLDGNNFEIHEYSKRNRQIYAIDQAALEPQARLSYLNKIHWEFSEVIGVIAQLLKGGAINPAAALSSGDNFRHVVNGAGFRNNNLDSTKNLEKSTQNIKTTLDTIEEYNNLIQACKIAHTYNGEKITIRLTISTKDKTGSFELNTELEPGTTNRLIGPSGAGKSTIFELLKGGINPALGSGTIEIPKNHLFLPQIPYIIKGNSYSLMQTILYPSIAAATIEQIELAKQLLREFQFESAIIDQLMNDGEKDWDADLSPGQKQIIAIISCLIKKPNAIFLDEPFAAMDPTSRNTAIRLLQKLLPKAIILYIEHKRNEKEPDSSEEDSFKSNNTEIQIIEEDF